MNKGNKKLNELLEKGSKSELEISAIGTNNLGNNTLITKVPLYDFYRMSKVANERSINGEPITQRKLDMKHATELARYILKALLISIGDKDGEEEENFLNKSTKENLLKIVGTQPYIALQPIVVNLRTAGKDGSNLNAEQIKSSAGEQLGLKVYLNQQDLFYVVDGQHRREAMHLVINFLEEVKREHKYPTKKSSIFPHNRDDRVVPEDELNIWFECDDIIRKSFNVNIEIHLGLGILEERQLFHDLNNLGKKVEKSLALEFDSSNPINSFIKKKLIESGLIHICEKEKVDWEKDEGELSRKDLVGVNARLFLNKANITSATPNIVELRVDIAEDFWDIISQIQGFGEYGAKSKTVIAQPVVLKAIAKLVYDFAFGKKKSDELLKKLFDGIMEFDFSHDNCIWRYYQLTDEGRNIYGINELKNYLPSMETGNRDIGYYDGKWMRFGSKHNDIFPIIGDMLRWKMGLPSRRK